MFGLFSTQKKEHNIQTTPDVIEEFLTRGVEKIFPSADFLRSKLVQKEKMTFYLGIDPTGSSLHLGHVIPLKKLSKLQKLGHKIILLMGDFTAMIGDPTDKTATRKKLTRDEVMNNLKEYKNQASKYISFSGENKAEIKFNSTWLGTMSFNNVLELASEMTVQQMLERDMFENRIKEGKPIYIHEFLYPLMQGYDSVAMDVDGEVGGNDQTFNMLAGRNLLKSRKNKEKFVIATKLLTDSSGKKMGKTENNMVSLNQNPEDMFGKVMSWSDDLIVPGFELVTDVSLSEISDITSKIESGENPRDFKVMLAKEIVSSYYGDKLSQKAEEEFNKTFTKGGVPDEVVEVNVSKETLLVDVLLEQNIVASKTEWRRLVDEGAVTHMDTGEKVSDSTEKFSGGVYKIGKRRFVKIIIT